MDFIAWASFQVMPRCRPGWLLMTPPRKTRTEPGNSASIISAGLRTHPAETKRRRTGNRSILWTGYRPFVPLTGWTEAHLTLQRCMSAPIKARQPMLTID